MSRKVYENAIEKMEALMRPEDVERANREIQPELDKIRKAKKRKKIKE